MADERAAMLGKEQPIPKGSRWADLANPSMEGDRLEIHYRKTLETLGKRGGMLGIIFRKAQNKIQDPAKLRRLIVDLIGNEDWLTMSTDVKGDAYEGLLERNAQDVKGGAGQYFTPRSVIQAMVECLQPRPARSSTTRRAAPAASCSPPTPTSRGRASSTAIRRSTCATTPCAASSSWTACLACAP
jgi:type I restriction enzyme M protein